MSRFNFNPSEEYQEVRQCIRHYAGALNGKENVKTAVADGLSEILREQFQSTWDLDKQSQPTCLARIGSSRQTCSHRGFSPTRDETRGPHHPPHHDHDELWVSNGEAVVYSIHLYHVGGCELRDLLQFADHWDLGLEVVPYSHYFPNATVHIVFYDREWMKSRINSGVSGGNA